MKKTTIPKGIIQGLLFNITIFIIFVVLGINYFLPEYSTIENKKTELNNLQKENSDLLTKGLKFSEFKKLYLKDSSLSDYLKNILTDSSKNISETYKENLVNNGTGSYKNFILEKNEEIKNKELSLEDSKIKEKIEKILPYYKADASLEENGLTDFKFVNYMEKIIHYFGLKYKGSIGVGSFVLEESSSSFDSKKTKNQQEGEIYSFKLTLNIDGPKKNIIDFIYYLEKVGTISFKDNGEDIEIEEVIKQKKYIDENGDSIKNDFYNLSRYFLGEKDIFNNLIVDIDSIRLKDYMDSSANPISYDKGETFIGFIKNDQTNEKYEVDLVLKFYVKGLEKYKTKKYIDNVTTGYKDLQKIISSGIQYGKKNSSKLSNKSNISLKELEKFSSYLNYISKDIKSLSNTERLDSELGNVYKEAQRYKGIFSNISKSLDTHLKSVSENIYNNYKKN